ncbi:Serine/threonine-protein phosphatase 7 long form like [Apostasia shenzhenica]|uniref:Serine/threonine-protein phosphatase 7 long form like n=1 Tax=Apostasia shenzhenica TaxID=1088818 RepID=A0A2I0B428_9ASPA|nr:Serine/threonine-protein phosphatase 7 long form like [Apostasia shenzhenica]
MRVAYDICLTFIDALDVADVGNIKHLSNIRLDHLSITALIECWSLETNTFHLPIGEMTITLQDIIVILGVQIDGDPLISHLHVGEGYI